MPEKNSREPVRIPSPKEILDSRIKLCNRIINSDTIPRFSLVACGVHSKQVFSEILLFDYQSEEIPTLIIKDFISVIRDHAIAERFKLVAMEGFYNTADEIQTRIDFLKEQIEVHKNDFFIIYGYTKEIEQLQEKLLKLKS